jgi:ElaB/YqjD/DUF883 family membrane-anchored ribosome-binding protein
MSNEWGENKPTKRLTKRLQESDASHDSDDSGSGAVRRIAGDAYSQMQRLERSAELQIRRYPLSSILIATGVGMALGGLMVAALTDSVRARSYRRNWTRFF